uniref:peptidylprolyl isomerase n=1 Tax=Chaetoceros debilis TaxID=122233 RepID=A0A7S3PW23_9STRA|mmetsp:Transcript_6755/g.9940  ORF Transcript_6755/g.9940 Transcript_6755/m.9940 type:complete len:182 (+) Transcript_6755:162-707(+)|eukprot:CAMPEP_0194088074 /NCGR_PEP_ID=MMETSP0149-20130528/27707_1 /TAXON_ID=122233 /ORGANISM="Chaetoceros debilis, Strain MM31A-1" /LENGTH=181 /DNA_ID=CAMNT_0038771649 /DNA_START=165 /DNA_END=710 /DNA_ORIENTATION=-
MMKSVIFLFALLSSAAAFSVQDSNSNTRRNFFTTLTTGASAAAAAVIAPNIANAGPEILKLDSGIKYAITKPSEKGKIPLQGDLVLIEYTGYLTNGQIFDATHGEGKKNGVLYKLGSTAVIPGLNEVVANMRVGEKVQAIIPPSLAFADDGICLENGECLIKPGSTLVYDVLLKKTSIPPP